MTEHDYGHLRAGKPASAAPAQINPELLERIERIDAETAPPPKERPGEAISPDSVDFDTVLKSVSGDTLEVLPDAPALADELDEGQRDLNLSEVITRIRDEGPAEGAVADAPPPPPAAETQPRPEPEPQAQPTAPRQTPPPPGLPTWLKGALGGLALAVVALGGWGYQQRLQQAELAQRLAATQALVAQLQEQQEALGARALQPPKVELPADLVHQSELSRRLAEQQARLDEQLTYLLSLVVPQAGVTEDTQPPAAEPEPAAAPAPKGPWAVHLRSYGSRKAAERARDALAGKLDGLAVRKASYKGKPIYRLSVVGLATKAEASALRKRAEKHLGFKGAWIGKVAP